MDTPGETRQRPSGLTTAAIVVFWIMVGILALLMIGAFLLLPMDSPIGAYLDFTFFPAATVFFVLSVALIILAAKAKFQRVLKVFLIITGSAGPAILAIFLLVHVNYELTKLTGVDMLANPGWLGGALFILILFGCPLVFLVGAVGTIVMLIRGKHRQPPATPP